MKRRDFCQTAGLAAGVLLVPSLLTRSSLGQSFGGVGSEAFTLQLSGSDLFRPTDLKKEIVGFATEHIRVDELGSSARIYWRIIDEERNVVDLPVARDYGYFEDRDMLPHLVDMYNSVTLPWILATRGSAVDTESENETPNVYELGQNYPNPFHERTTIPFSLAEGGRTRIDVYNLVGKKVTRLVDADLPAGIHEVTWDRASAASGMYTIVFTSGSFRQTRQVVLVN